MYRSISTSLGCQKRFLRNYTIMIAQAQFETSKLNIVRATYLTKGSADGSGKHGVLIKPNWMRKINCFS